MSFKNMNLSLQYFLLTTDTHECMKDLTSLCGIATYLKFCLQRDEYQFSSLSGQVSDVYLLPSHLSKSSFFVLGIQTLWQSYALRKYMISMV